MEGRNITHRLSACLEWLFAEGDPPLADRVDGAAEAGLRQVEFWYWRERDVDELYRRASGLGVRIGAIVTDPAALGDEASHRQWFEGVEESADTARRLGVDVLVASAGNRLPSVPLVEQLACLHRALSGGAAIAERSGVRLAVEPLNDRVDHRGTLLTGTDMALEVLDGITADAIGVLWDVYHGSVQGEELSLVPKRLGSRLAYVQVADNPGRHEPGTGQIDWPSVLTAVEGAGYTGPIGLEYRPTMPSDQSVARTAAVLASCSD